MRWAMCVPKSELPPILLTKHTDWPKLFQWVPRRWNAFIGPPPMKIWGNAKSTKPIPDAGEWWIGWPLYFGIKTKRGWYIRFGFRYDDIDRYFTIPSFTIKKYPT